MVLSQSLAKFRGDALRKCRGDPRSDADNLHMGDFSKRSDDLFDLIIFEHEGIPATENDISDLGMTADVLDASSNRALRHRARVTDLALACAITAINRALIVDVEEHSVGITVRESGGG
jgi:hypothetical protein